MRPSRKLRRRAGLLCLAAVAAVGPAACSDPPTTEAEGSGERPEECGEPSSMQLTVDGTPVEFTASSSVANHVDDETWLVAVGDVDDREPVEAEHDGFVRPGTGLVGAAVTHQMRCTGNRVDE